MSLSLKPITAEQEHHEDLKATESGRVEEAEGAEDARQNALELSEAVDIGQQSCNRQTPTNGG